MKTDHYFQDFRPEVRPFTFDEEVADCFDDMVSRSVPYYHEIHRILLDILPYQVRDGDVIYDLGCSTGTTLKVLSKGLESLDVKLVGLDQSPPMIAKAKEKCSSCHHGPDFYCQDVLTFPLEECGLVIMNYTLQFVPRHQRAELVQRIHQSLRPGGMFVLTEKIESPDRGVQNLQTNLYWDFKRRNGYSELEIAQKRDALEDVLVPLSPTDQMELLSESGFGPQVDMIFRWYNFACFVGIK